MRTVLFRLTKEELEYAIAFFPKGSDLYEKMKKGLQLIVKAQTNYTPKKVGRPKVLVKETKQDVLRLHMKGVSNREISRQLKVSCKTVINCLKEFGAVKEDGRWVVR